MEIIQKIANSIDEDVQFIIEVASDNEDNKIPYLDTKIWMEREDPNYPQGKVMHIHYSKPMVAKVGIQKESAISHRDQRTINTQEVIRVLRNCHDDIETEECNEKLTEAMKKLQNSGYDSAYRKEVLISALKGVEKQKEADKRGETPMYRPKGYRKMERLLEGS